MLYLDEEARDQYHKCGNTLLQVISSIVESYFAQHGIQLRVIDVEPDVARFSIEEMDGELYEVISEVVMRVNKQFPRRDKKTTCYIASLDHGLVSVYVTKASDLTQLN